MRVKNYYGGNIFKIFEMDNLFGNDPFCYQYMGAQLRCTYNASIFPVNPRKYLSILDHKKKFDLPRLKLRRQLCWRCQI